MIHQNHPHKNPLSTPKKERKLKAHHKHALRIGAWLGVLLLVIGIFASARTSFFGLFEKNVNDRALTGFVPCIVDATGGCLEQNEPPCEINATGGCTPQNEAQPCILDPTGGCLPPNPHIPNDCLEVDATGACVPTGAGDPEEIPLPHIPNDCLEVDATGACAPLESFEPEGDPQIPEDFPVEENLPLPEPLPVQVPEIEIPVLQPKEEPVLQPNPDPDPIIVPIVKPVSIIPSITQAVPLEPPLIPKPVPPIVSTFPLNVPEDSCLYFDPNRSILMADVNPENKPINQLSTLQQKAIVVLSKSYVKNPDGSRTYIIEGSAVNSKDPQVREFLPEANIIRRDAAKLEILIHCLDIKSVDYLKRAGQTVSGKAMPNFNDLPLDKIQSFNDAIIYSAGFYDIINGTIYGSKIQADGQRDILVGEAIKTLVRTRQMILGNVLTQDSPQGPWYQAFFDSALDEGLGVEDLRISGNQPITRGRFAQELLELALLRHMYNHQEEVEALLYSSQ